MSDITSPESVRPSKTLERDIMGQRFIFSEIDRFECFDLSFQVKSVMDAALQAVGENQAALMAADEVAMYKVTEAFCRGLSPALARELRSAVFARASVVIEGGTKMQVLWALQAGKLQGGIPQAQIALVYGIMNSFGPFGRGVGGDFLESIGALITSAPASPGNAQSGG